MKYMVLIANGEEGWDHLDAEEQRALMGRIGSWWDERVAAGEILDGYQLQPVETATTVRVARDGGASVTDGPFVEGKEAVGGYALFDVPDLDAAIRLASGWPAPDVLEIRPVVDNAG
jgi:hypothetical protein